MEKLEKSSSPLRKIVRHRDGYPSEKGEEEGEWANKLSAAFRGVPRRRNRRLAPPQRQRAEWTASGPVEQMGRRDGGLNGDGTGCHDPRLYAYALPPTPSLLCSRYTSGKSSENIFIRNINEYSIREKWFVTTLLHSRIFNTRCHFCDTTVCNNICIYTIILLYIIRYICVDITRHIVCTYNRLFNVIFDGRKICYSLSAFLQDFTDTLCT